MDNQSDTTQIVQSLVDRLRAGDEKARDELIQAAYKRLVHLARREKRRFPSVGEQTQDVFQISVMRIREQLKRKELNDARHFFNWAARVINRQMIDLKRRYYGPEKGDGANIQPQGRASDGSKAVNPIDIAPDEAANGLEKHSDLYEAIEKLPEEQQEIVNMRFIHELTQAKTAKLLGISERQVRRKWVAAKESLFDLLAAE